ncbi:Zonadhesin [Manis javanica]|nr:Zonadhesin [Manis javanica]
MSSILRQQLGGRLHQSRPCAGLQPQKLADQRSQGHAASMRLASPSDAWGAECQWQTPGMSCDILMNPVGPFSQCHREVAPHSSFTSCVYGQCGSKGNALTLCRSLQAYAARCALASWAPSWHNSTFCPECPALLPHGPKKPLAPQRCFVLRAAKCQKSHVLSGMSCVPLGQCGCTDQGGLYHAVRESWYTDTTCSRLCTCSTDNISCIQTACKLDYMCWPLDGLIPLPKHRYGHVLHLKWHLIHELRRQLPRHQGLLHICPGEGAPTCWSAAFVGTSVGRKRMK